MKKVFVVGGHGFLGKALVAQLAKDPALTISIYDRSDDSSQQIISSLSGCDTIYFLAGIKDSSDPQLLAVNLDWFEKILQLVSQYAPQSRVIFSSSVAVYEPKSTEQAISEVSKTGPRNRYGLSKLLAEESLKFYCQNQLINSAVVLRIANIYGPSQTDLVDSSVVTKFMKCIKDKKPAILDNGGSQTRDFIYIDDVVNALVKAGQPINSEFKIVNIGSNQSISLTKLVELVSRTANTQLEIQSTNRPDLKDDFWQIDTKLAYELLDWVPKISLEEGLKRVWASIQ